MDEFLRRKIKVAFIRHGSRVRKLDDDIQRRFPGMFVDRGEAILEIYTVKDVSDEAPITRHRRIAVFYVLFETTAGAYS